MPITSAMASMMDCGATQPVVTMDSTQRPPFPVAAVVVLAVYNALILVLPTIMTIDGTIMTEVLGVLAPMLAVASVEDPLEELLVVSADVDEVLLEVIAAVDDVPLEMASVDVDTVLATNVLVEVTTVAARLIE